jgi:hypothetical protein
MRRSWCTAFFCLNHREEQEEEPNIMLHKKNLLHRAADILQNMEDKEKIESSDSMNDIGKGNKSKTVFTKFFILFNCCLTYQEEE